MDVVFEQGADVLEPGPLSMVAGSQPSEKVVEVRKPPRWPIVLLLLALIGVAGTGLWIIRLKMRPQGPADLSLAVGVRSEIRVAGDSLDVVVFWRLTEPASAAPADSVRIEVGLGTGAEPQILLTPNTHNTDTLRIPAPKAGETASGYSCVAAVHGPRLSRETCTPWQYVRPMAQAPSGPVVVDTAPARRPGSRAGPRLPCRSSGSWFSRPDSRWTRTWMAGARHGSSGTRAGRSGSR